MGPHPFHIWLIAGTYWAASALAVWYSWPSANAPGSPVRAETVFTMAFALYPGLLGLLLILGKRWVRWLFIPLIPLVAAIAVLVSYGNAMRTVPQAIPETVWLWGFDFVAVLSAVAVIVYLADKPKA